jgi:hypothetical protein
MEVKSRMSTWTRLGTWIAAVLLAAAACSGQPAEVSDGTDSSGFRLVELDPDAISIDDLDLGENDAAAGEEPAENEPVTVSRAAAEAALPFALALPGWAPAGYELLDEVQIVGADDPTDAAALLTWRHADHADIVLSVSSGAGGGLGQAGPGESTEVTVAGQPARLRHSQGLGPERLALHWSAHGLSYSLSTTGGAVTAEDLVRMAEAVP